MQRLARKRTGPIRTAPAPHGDRDTQTVVLQGKQITNINSYNNNCNDNSNNDNDTKSWKLNSFSYTPDCILRPFTIKQGVKILTRSLKTHISF